MDSAITRRAFMGASAAAVGGLLAHRAAHAATYEPGTLRISCEYVHYRFRDLIENDPEPPIKVHVRVLDAHLVRVLFDEDVTFTESGTWEHTFPGAANYEVSAPHEYLADGEWMVDLDGLLSWWIMPGGVRDVSVHCHRIGNVVNVIADSDLGAYWNYALASFTVYDKDGDVFDQGVIDLCESDGFGEYPVGYAYHLDVDDGPCHVTWEHQDGIVGDGEWVVAHWRPHGHASVVKRLSM